MGAGAPLQVADESPDRASVARATTKSDAAVVVRGTADSKLTAGAMESMLKSNDENDSRPPASTADVATSWPIP